MILTKKEDRFICLTRYEEKDIPKAAGFKWEPNDKYWYTKDSVIAAKLVGYSDSTCKIELSSLSVTYNENIIASKAKDADIVIPAPEGLEYMPFQKAGIKFALKIFKALK
jgi:SWI/SNF-related matrix-associated actin-dependent regulator 1 of chromatin subfamily A